MKHCRKGANMQISIPFGWHVHFASIDVEITIYDSEFANNASPSGTKVSYCRRS
jgi:hypothetical protein